MAASFPTFPGPQTFFSAREGWLRTTVKAALGTAYGIFMILIDAPLGFLVTAFFCFFMI